MVLDSYKDSGIQNIKTMVAIAPQEFHLSEDDEIADFNFELDGWRNDFMKIESADAAPVRRGRWKYERLPSTSGGSYAVVRCSECEYQYPMAETRYCPNCGAKMDGERKDNDGQR
jgi:hypothetical protein